MKGDFSWENHIGLRDVDANRNRRSTQNKIYIAEVRANRVAEVNNNALPESTPKFRVQNK